ncbi:MULTISPECIES: hypothetical protein [Shinella]|uniref:Uncharacterized protein n=1 Tax=Shinella granuli TaxID=323621 RepID=A0A4R2CYI7_SHIGR|nr:MULTISPECIES: hypothetical protein [Shinella]ANH05808.1 hypothetical protein shn_18405 [Shinella sp. HZN7]TCN45392.1 hypothetical protein EV665_107227 [Shinella granuli]
MTKKPENRYDRREDGTGMSTKADIDALQLELWATQYWMKYLYVAQAKGERMRSADILDLIEELKATAPSDEADRFPVCERVGLEIAALLRKAGN